MTEPHTTPTPEDPTVSAAPVASGISPDRFFALVRGRWRSAGILIPFLILFITLTIASSSFLTKANLLNILDQQASTLIIAAAGTMVLVSGGIDLSVGAVYGLASVVTGELVLHGWPSAIAIVAGVLSCS